MSKKKDNPGRFMLRSECTEMMNRGAEQFKEIKSALVGEEFGKIGGMLKELADIKEELKNLKKGKWKTQDKALILVTAISVAGSIITAIIAYLKP